MPPFKIALVGEAYGEEEERYNKPFIGKSGQQLDTLLADAGIQRQDCFITNVFNLRPPGNNLEALCDTLKSPDIIRGLPALAKGKYLRKEFAPHLERLADELELYKPNIVVLLGNTACWAVLGSGAISKVRGTCAISRSPAGLKVLPTYHPAAVLRQHELRPVTVLDLIKAKRESEFPELRRPLREIWMDPTLEDLNTFYERYIVFSKRIAFDVETAFNQITCIGLATSIDRAIVVPFLDYRKPGGHYWKTPEDEVAVWQWVKRALSSSARYVGQNGLYDVQYLWKAHGIPCRLDDDTMLLHHALQPESPKSLGFLGSVYTNEIAWKPQRPRSKHNEKPEDAE